MLVFLAIVSAIMFVVGGMMFFSQGGLEHVYENSISIEEMVSIINDKAYELYVDDRKQGVDIYRDLMDIGNSPRQPEPLSWIPWFPNASLIEYGAACKAVAKEYL